MSLRSGDSDCKAEATRLADRLIIMLYMLSSWAVICQYDKRSQILRRTLLTPVAGAEENHSAEPRSRVLKKGLQERSMQFALRIKSLSISSAENVP